MKISYTNATSFKVVFYFLLLIFAIPFYFVSGGTWWSFILVILASTFVNACHGICWHRWLCHKSFTPHTIGKYLMLFGTSIQGSNRPLYLIAAHRLHHKYPDQPEDPHSPRDRSFLETWLGRFKVNPLLLIKQLNKDDFKNKELMFIQKHYYKIFFIFYFIFCLISLKIAILFLAWSYTYTNLATSVIAYYSHFTEDGINYKARNMPRVFSSLCLGEGLHKNHHDFPGNWNFALNKNEVDAGAKFIRLFLK